MAKGRKRKSGRQADETEDTLVVESPDVDMSEGLRPGRFTLAEYMVVVVLFILFLGAQALVVWLWTGETGGMKYFFVSLGIGFTVVAVFSWLHDAFYRGDEPGEDDSST